MMFLVIVLVVTALFNLLFRERGAGQSLQLTPGGDGGAMNSVPDPASYELREHYEFRRADED